MDAQRVTRLDAIARAAARANAPRETLELFEGAKRESRFSDAIAMVSPAIPRQLLIRGHNPLTLLNGTLRDGVHEMSDEECLSVAHSIRIVLSELADRIANIVKDETELDAAVSDLLKARRPASASGTE